MGSKAESSVFRPAFVIMSGRAVGFIASFAMPIVLVRIFTQTEFGTYKQLFLIYGTLFAIAQLGMAESLYYFMPGASKKKANYLVNSLIVLAISGGICLILLWMNAARIAYWFNNPALGQYIPYIGVFFLIMLIAVVLEITMITRRHHGLAFGAYALSDIFRALFFVLPALVLHSLQALLLGAIAFAVVRLFATLAYLKRQHPERFQFDYARWKEHLAYALPFALAVGVQTIQGNLHLYIVSNRFDTATFAIYAVGCLQVPLVEFLMTSTSSVMMVKMREYISEDRNVDVLDLWRDTTRKLVLIFAPLVGIMLVTAHALIVTLYTMKYARSVPIFEVWSVAMLFAALLTDSIMRVYAQTRFLIVLNLVRLTVLAATIFYLMDKFGLIGAVVAALFAALAAKIVALWKSKVVMKCSTAQLLPWKNLALIVIIAAIAAIPALAIRFLVPLPLIAKLFLIPSIYIGTYFVVLWRYGPLEQNEKQMMKNSTRHFASRYLMPWCS